VIAQLIINWCTRARGFATDGSFVAQRESRFRLHCVIQVQDINCSQEEAFDNLLSRLEEDTV